MFQAYLTIFICFFKILKKCLNFENYKFFWRKAVKLRLPNIWGFTCFISLQYVRNYTLLVTKILKRQANTTSHAVDEVRLVHLSSYFIVIGSLIIMVKSKNGFNYCVKNSTQFKNQLSKYIFYPRFSQINIKRR